MWVDREAEGEERQNLKETPCCAITTWDVWTPKWWNRAESETDTSVQTLWSVDRIQRCGSQVTKDSVFQTLLGAMLASWLVLSLLSSLLITWSVWVEMPLPFFGPGIPHVEIKRLNWVVCHISSSSTPSLQPSLSSSVYSRAQPY